MLSGGTFSKSSLKLFTLKYLFLISIKSTQTNKICLTVKRLSQAIHCGGSSFFKWMSESSECCCFLNFGAVNKAVSYLTENTSINLYDHHNNECWRRISRRQLHKINWLYPKLSISLHTGDQKPPKYFFFLWLKFKLFFQYRENLVKDD